MTNAFYDHPRKHTIRNRWNAPLLRHLHQLWGTKYFYVGLPGTRALDIKLWKDMIDQVIAFELEELGSAEPRRNITSLIRELTLLNIPNIVYCGTLEEVFLEDKDYDGKPLKIDRLVTLFNLDFCNSFTGRVDTIDRKRRCLRFEAIRQIIAIQRNLFRVTGSKDFVVLLTVHDSFHVNEMQRFISKPDLPTDTATFLRARRIALPGGDRVTRDTELLKIFIFSCLRDYLHGLNVKSYFLPPVQYAGHKNAPMIHFSIICSMESNETAQVIDTQTISNFLKLPRLRATDNDLINEKTGSGGIIPNTFFPTNF